MFTVVRLLSLILAVFGAPVSGLLLCVCHTREGTVFGAASLLITLAPILGCIARERESRRLFFAAQAMAAGWVVLTIWLGVHAPDGRVAATSPVQHRYADGDWQYPRLALGNLLPELDQFRLGFRLVPALDPLFTLRQARHLSALTTEIYDELEADVNFHALGSVMPHAYDEAWGLGADRSHYYLYIPPRLDRTKPAPLLMFLHGSGGSFKAYTWLLAKVADDLGMVLICPSYGMGNWRGPDTANVLKAALKDAASVVAIDPLQQHLMGLSNGGLGVSQAGQKMGDQFASLTFLSPVFDSSAAGTVEFKKHWKGRPIHILTGVVDDRVPLPYVTSVAATLEAQGAKVDFGTVEGADHFMLFSHRGQVISSITSWLKKILEK